MDIFVCPECSCESFVHHNPSKPHPNVEPIEEIHSVRTLKSRESGHAPLPAPKEIDPEKLAMFKARFVKELEEIEYLEWRARQPGWKNEEVQQRIKNISATAAGVAIGTSFLRSQLGAMSESLSTDSDQESTSWLGDLFN